MKLIILLFAFLPICVSLFIMPILPANVPSHWNVYGEITARGSKYVLLVHTFASIVMMLIFLIVNRLHSNSNIRNFMCLLFLGIIILFNLLFYNTLLHVFCSIKNIHFPITKNRINFFLFGAIILYIGLLLPQLPRDFIAGRAPWLVNASSEKILVFKKVWSVGWCLIGSSYSIFALFAPSSILPFGTVCFFILVGLHPLISSFMKFKF